MTSGSALRLPLVAITICFILGILSPSILAPLLFGVCLLLVAITAALVTKQPLPVLMLAMATLLGYARTAQVASIPDTDISRLAGRRVTLAGLITSVSGRTAPAGSRFHTVGVTLEVDRAAIGQNAPLKPVSGWVHATLGVVHSTPQVGDMVEITGDLELPEGLRNPGGTDYAALLALRGIYAVIAAPVPRAWHVIEKSRGPLVALRAAIAGMRSTIERTATESLPTEKAAVLKGILLGDNEDISEDLKDDFEQTGTVHILATAGLHVGIASIALFSLLKWTGAGYRRAALITAILLALYATLAGGRASVTRAVTVADVWLMALVIAREPNVWTALAFAALLQLVGNPLMLYDAGFQMSFATVLTIMVTMPLAAGWLKVLGERTHSTSRWKRAGHWTMEKLAEIAVLSVCAQIGAAPLVAHYFYNVSLVSALANITVIPAVIPVMWLALAGAALSLLSPALGGLLFKLTTPLLGYIALAIHYWARVPFASCSVKAPPLPVIAIYYAAVWAIAIRKTANSEIANGA